MGTFIYWRLLVEYRLDTHKKMKDTSPEHT